MLQLLSAQDSIKRTSDTSSTLVNHSQLKTTMLRPTEPGEMVKSHAVFFLHMNLICSIFKRSYVRFMMNEEWRNGFSNSIKWNSTEEARIVGRRCYSKSLENKLKLKNAGKLVTFATLILMPASSNTIKEISLNRHSLLSTSYKNTHNA